MDLFEEQKGVQRRSPLRPKFHQTAGHFNCLSINQIQPQGPGQSRGRQKGRQMRIPFGPPVWDAFEQQGSQFAGSIYFRIRPGGDFIAEFANAHSALVGLPFLPD